MHAAMHTLASLVLPLRQRRAKNELLLLRYGVRSPSAALHLWLQSVVEKCSPSEQSFALLLSLERVWIPCCPMQKVQEPNVPKVAVETLVVQVVDIRLMVKTR